ncbi:MAG: lytic murein transglycosylase [Candidatus Spechtbacterales bacterium]
MNLLVHNKTAWGTRIGTALLLAVFVFMSGPAALAQSKLSPEERARLEKDLRQLEQQVAQFESEIKKYQEEGNTYEQKVSALNSQIYQIQAQMARNELILDQTSANIQENERSIEFLQEKGEKQKNLLANLVLDYYQTQESSPIEIVIGNDSLSDFFDDVQRRTVIQEGLKITLAQVQALKAEVEQEQLQLAERVDEQMRVLGIQTIQREGLAGARGEQEVLLNEARNNEEAIEGQADAVRKSIADIRSQLYVLENAGVATSFGQAYEYAKVASNLTGVRPAFLLAVLKRESSWGQNVGLCYLVDPTTGLGKGRNTGNLYERVMKPDRDVQPFLQITASLGRDPYNTLVSCPHPDYGYGGAMGPAQFIPSTWMGYKDRVAAILGRQPDPWNIQDAFIASAVKLASGGATAQTEAAEWKAAMIYYAGGGWNNPTYAPYGNWIINQARAYQADINILEGR